MPTQKIFKQRVRARMTKTGESYTAARRQLLRKAGESTAPERDEGTVSDDAAESTPATELLMSDEAMIRGSGRSHAEWFTLLDAWGATERGHTEIAAWLRTEHGVDGWWAQGVTVGYERARGKRGRHQQRDGYTIGVRKSVGVEPAQALAAFTNGSLRRRWLPDAPMRQRPTKAALSARFDWSDPTSRVVVTIVSKGPDKATVAISHERLPDAESAERFKGAWRQWLADLKSVVERG
jgi:hypothetical protein